MTTTTKNNHRPILTTIAFLLFLISVEPPWAAAQFGRGPPPPANFGPGTPRVDLKMAIVMVLLVTVFFVLGFLSVYTRQCAQERFRARLELTFVAAAADGGGAHDPNWASHGLSADAVAAFPTFLYSSVKGHKIGKGSLECAVCLSEFGGAETLRLIPKCDHVFHRDCIDAWLSSHATCPVCRANLVPKPGEDHGHSLAEFLSPAAEEPAPVPEPAVVGGIPPVRPPRSRSTGFGLGRAAGAFPRSLSTGHLPLRQGESFERFTLRLPEEVRSRLVNHRSGDVAAGMPRVGSGRRGFRSGSVRRKDGSVYERFDPETKAGDGRWVFSVVPPFVTRSGSVRTAPGDDDVANRHKAGSSSSDQAGERSTDRLRPEDQV